MTDRDRAFLQDPEEAVPLQHANIRGGGYYHWESTKMLTHPTHDRLLAADPMGGLTGIAKALEEQRRPAAFDFDDLSFEERLGLLVDRGEPEYKTIRGIVFPANAERDGKKLAARRKFAALRQDASVEDLDLRTPRGALTAVSWRI